MRALILAAGVGSRISRHLQGQPKCCVLINGIPLIRYTYELLKKHGINEIAVVTGYQSKYIHQALEDLPWINYFNPFYRVANSVSSLWFSRDFLCNEDLLVMNGDVYLDDSILDKIMLDNRSPLLLADSSRIEDADYRFKWKDNKLQDFGKDLSDSETTGEYVGVALLDLSYQEGFKQKVIDAVSSEDYHCWWEDVIYRTVNEGENVHIVDVNGAFWAEVDFIEDYNRINQHLKG